ncbi:HTH-type transcriptional repressor NsrR [Myxococcaceae bacterium]|nr:HTH-type transcriptional repressor NsrR [Myxococcaceae bacterium]
MRLTRHSDYALRVLMRLATAPDERATVDQIADAYGISRAHLVKIVHRLARQGYVETSRGRHGGIRLARSASRIGLGDVIRDTEEIFALAECFAPDGEPCRIEAACGLRGVLDEAQEAFFEVLDRHTLADLVDRRAAALSRLLGVVREGSHARPR